MNRPRVSVAIETSILILSRRRCALCYGLHEDVGVKAGQIAHINRNSSDHRLENLAFLCLQHHDEYDSRRSQSKGFTESELRHYVAKLNEYFNREERETRVALDLFSSLRDLVPQKWQHVCEEALEFYTGPHRTQSAVLATLEGPKSIAAITERIPPNDFAQTSAIVAGAVDQGWLHRSVSRTDEYEATVRARVIVEALADFPEAVKDAAVKAIWHLGD
jgi:hypothetical protein